MNKKVLIFFMFIAIASNQTALSDTQDLKRIIAIQQAQINSLQKQVDESKQQFEEIKQGISNNATKISNNATKTNNNTTKISNNATNISKMLSGGVCKLVKHANGSNCTGGYRYVMALGAVRVGGAGYSFRNGPKDVDLCCK